MTAIVLAQNLAGLTLAEARRRVTTTLSEGGIVESADTDARLLVGAALGIDHTMLASEPGRTLSDDDAKTLAALVARRLNHEPIARILGHREFWSLRFALSPDTLVPRPDTETVVEAALAHVRERRTDALRIADLGTGSGIILLALLHELPSASGVGTDRSTGALLTARMNAAALSLSERAMFAAGDFSAALRGPFDLIVSNPPYIETSDIDHLQMDVRAHEPRLALDGGADGLFAYRAIAADAPRLLAPGGALVVELGYRQHDAVCGIMAAAGLAPKGPAKPDLAGIPRALTLVSS